VGSQAGLFRDCLGRLLTGKPAGHALRELALRGSYLASDLLETLDTTRPGAALDDGALAWAWTEQRDARNYALLGDPAVRLRVEDLP
jgi:hypothetical protein